MKKLVITEIIKGIIKLGLIALLMWLAYEYTFLNTPVNLIFIAIIVGTIINWIYGFLLNRKENKNI